MQKQGTVVRWDANRAFGFIRSPDTSADVFFHVRDFRGSTPPREGLAVVYEEIHVGGKGPRAMAVLPVAPAAGAFQPQSPTRTQSTSPRPTRHTPAQRAGPTQPAQRRRPAVASQPPNAAGSALIHLLMLGWVGLLAWGLWAGRLPWRAAGRAHGLPSNGCGTSRARRSSARCIGRPWYCTARRWSGRPCADECHLDDAARDHGRHP